MKLSSKEAKLRQLLHMNNDNDGNNDCSSSSSDVVVVDLWKLREFALSKDGLINGT
jgi:hypothetical protein